MVNIFSLNSPCRLLSLLAIFATCRFAIAQPLPYEAVEFAVEVIEYEEGAGVGVDSITLLPFNDPLTALGRPTVDTTGDLFAIPLDETVPVVPVYGPFRSFEIVTVGLGGRLILRFDRPVWNHPRNPYGVDLIVFGNATATINGQSSWFNGDPANTIIQSQTHFSEPGEISVSQDGITWHIFNDDVGPHAIPGGEYEGTDGPFADVFAPTLGRVYDPTNPDPSVGDWNLWWSHETNPTKPLDPRMRWSEFHGLTIAQVAEMYEDSAGGIGLDLAWLEQDELDWIQYIRVKGVAPGATPDVDAVADVFPHLGDADVDGDVDLYDFARFQACFTGPDETRALRICYFADFDSNIRAGEQDVDLDDFSSFWSYMTGPVE